MSQNSMFVHNLLSVLRESILMGVEPLEGGRLDHLRRNTTWGHVSILSCACFIYFRGTISL